MERKHSENENSIIQLTDDTSINPGGSTVRHSNVKHVNHEHKNSIKVHAIDLTSDPLNKTSSVVIFEDRQASMDPIVINSEENDGTAIFSSKQTKVAQKENTPYSRLA